MVIHAKNPYGIWTGGPYNRFLSSFLSHNLQPEVHGFSIGMVILPPGGKSEPHKHAEAQESWYILEGHGTVIIGENSEPIETGDVVYGPAGIVHTLVNGSGDKPLKALLILCPGGDEKNVTEHITLGEGVYYESYI